MTVPGCLAMFVTEEPYLPGSQVFGPGTHSFKVPPSVYKIKVNAAAGGGGGAGRADGSNGQPGGNTVVFNQTITGGGGGGIGGAWNGGNYGAGGHAGTPGGVGGVYGKWQSNTAPPHPGYPAFGFGGAGATDSGQWGSGGGGGSGGCWINNWITVVPGTVFSIVVGAGGNPGAPCANACPVRGADGFVRLDW